MTFHQWNARPRAGAGFTLVELLVVISIIALLISVLLPSLQRSRDVAWQAKCQSGARGTHGSIEVYANDFRDYYVQGAYGPGTWSGILIKGDYAQQTQFSNRGGCPHGPSRWFDDAGNDFYTGWLNGGVPTTRTSYGFNFVLQTGFNNNIGGTPRNYGPLRRSGTRTTRHGERVITTICNVTQWSTGNTTYPVYASTYTTLGEAPWYPKSQRNDEIVRHKGEGLPAMFADGHGAFVPRQVVLTGPLYGQAARTFANFNVMDFSFCPTDPSAVFGFPP